MSEEAKRPYAIVRVQFGDEEVVRAYCCRPHFADFCKVHTPTYPAFCSCGHCEQVCLDCEQASDLLNYGKEKADEYRKDGEKFNIPCDETDGANIWRKNR